MTCDIDSNISLVPLNAEGKPVELDDVTAGRDTDGDTSESYGSCKFRLQILMVPVSLDFRVLWFL